MKVEILCTGDEILTGKTVNTNYSHMARRLGEVGLTVTWGTTVGDDREDLIRAFDEASARADAVIVNGGLGPTVDDLSQEVAAHAAGVSLELHEEWLARMEDYYQRRGRVMPPNNRKQAMLPAGSEFIDNPVGTACGFALTIKNARFFFTPGVPREMRRMIDDQVIPRLLSIAGINVKTRLKRFHSFGIGESRADQLLDGVEALDKTGNIKLGFQAHYPQLEVKLAAKSETDAELDALLAPAEAFVRSKLGNSIIAEDDGTLEGAIIDRLGALKATLATAEMFTAGSIVNRLLPSLRDDRLINRGLVSRELAQLASAVGVESNITADKTDLQSAVTIAEGLKSASGASHSLVVLLTLDDKEDSIEFGGDIFIAIAGPDTTVTRHARMLGGREWVRLGAVEMALDTLRRHLHGLPTDEKIDFEKH